MKQDKKARKWSKTLVWQGRLETVECKIHSNAWSGQMPCTGIYRCVLCGRPEKGR